MLRLFVCIWLPDEIKERIIKFQNEMKGLPIDAKFVETENLHITITFLGYKDLKEFEKIKSGMTAALKDMKKFSVKIKGLKVIPNDNCIRVIGINIEDGDNILANLIRKAAKEIGGDYYEKQKITLCRVKKIYDKPPVRDFVNKNLNIEIGSFEINSVALVQSILTKHGPIYETIYKCPLQ
jgi:2'-5' RNA ligase